jgi:hypothetical protein
MPKRGMWCGQYVHDPRLWRFSTYIFVAARRTGHKVRRGPQCECHILVFFSLMIRSGFSRGGTTFGGPQRTVEVTRTWHAKKQF